MESTPTLFPLPELPPGYRWVYCRYYRQRRTGRLIFPKRAKFFRFMVKI